MRRIPARRRNEDKCRGGEWPLGDSPLLTAGDSQLCFGYQQSLLEENQKIISSLLCKGVAPRKLIFAFKRNLNRRKEAPLEIFFLFFFLLTCCSSKWAGSFGSVNVNFCYLSKKKKAPSGYLNVKKMIYNANLNCKQFSPPFPFWRDSRKYRCYPFEKGPVTYPRAYLGKPWTPTIFESQKMLKEDKVSTKSEKEMRSKEDYMTARSLLLRTLCLIMEDCIPWLAK